MLLSSSHGAVLHDAGSRVMYGASMLYVLAAILAWQRAAGPPAPCCTRPASSYSPRLWASRTCRRSMSPWGILMFGLSVWALGGALSTRLK